jgi:acyl-CoA thioesterase I
VRRLAAIRLACALLAASPVFAAAQSAPPPPAGAPSQSPQQSDDAASAPQPPALSRECQTPGINISGDVALPRITRAIKLRKSIKIVTIGASSKGGKLTSEDGYQQIIEAMLEKTIPGIDVKMINRGVSGELARDAADRIKTEVALTRPDLVLWQLGTHDALMHVPVSDFQATVAETVDWLRAHDVDVVMVGLHYLRNLVRDEHYQAVRAALRATAEQKKVLWIGRYEAMQVIEQARLMTAGPSPNEFTMTESGYSCLSEYVARALTSGAFARPPPRR